MSFLFTMPEAVSAAARELANLGSTITGAHSAAAVLTTELVPAAEDEVSGAIAAVFGKYSQQYQALALKAAEFHEGFVQAVTAAADSYLAAESANVAALLRGAQQGPAGAINAGAEAVLGRPLTASGAGSSVATGAVAATVVNSMATPVDTTIVLGYTGAPIPSSNFISAVNRLFIEPNLISAKLQTLYTPEQDYPFTGVRSMTGDASIAQGVQILNNQILSLYHSGTHSIGVFGYSQGATIASNTMQLLQAEGVPSSAVHFVLMGDSTPNGGLSERFVGLQMPSMGSTNSGATPSNAYPTTIYTLEYDMFADFPRYPLNLLSDLNAIVGGVHFDYTSLTAAQVQNAIHLPISGPTMTDYYMIPVQNLPLLNPVREIPIIGNPIADLLQPDMTYLVNLGYGDPLYGWSTSPANVNTPIGFLPPMHSFEELPGLLVGGAGQGIHNFVGDFMGSGPNPVTPPSLSSITSLLGSASGTGGSTSGPNPVTPPSLNSITSMLGPALGTGGSTSSVASPFSALQAFAIDPASTMSDQITGFANTVSNAASSAYGVLLPTADIINAAAISIPAYDASLFLNNLCSPVDAIGLPIAANTGLYSMLLNDEIEVLSTVVPI